MSTASATPSFQGLRVLGFESRRGKELAALISTYGGTPVIAPALREVPIESNAAALEFAAALVGGDFEIVVFLTGVGTRALIDAIAPTYSRDVIVDALSRTRVVARGPKPLAVLRGLGVPIWVSAPEPNTWRELVSAIDEKSGECPLAGARIAVQEYGVSNAELLDELRRRGARVMAVPVYEWALPEDLGPLKSAVAGIAGSQVDVVVFTTSVQVAHLWRIVKELDRESDVRLGLARTVIASIGPTTSEALHRYGLNADIEASHPKIGFLVRELAERSGRLLLEKRGAR